MGLFVLVLSTQVKFAASFVSPAPE